MKLVVILRLIWLIVKINIVFSVEENEIKVEEMISRINQRN